MPWQDLPDAMIEVGDPTQAETGAILRERDIANASCALPMTYSPTLVGAQCFYADGWKTSLTLRVTLPHALPDKWEIYLPHRVYLYGQYAPPVGATRLKIGSLYGTIIGYAPSGTTFEVDILARCALPATLAGAEVDIEIQCLMQTAGVGNYVQAKGSSPEQAARFSIRRPARALAEEQTE